jgi:hypothetical protein
MRLPLGRMVPWLQGLAGIGRVLQTTRYDAAVDAVNRLPRPLMALGAIGFFVYSVLSPPSFRDWMGALATVPEPVWWMVTGILGLHFGAREAHYLRGPRPDIRAADAPPGSAGAAIPPRSAHEP